MSELDAIVIGGGLGGLTCAAYLAAAGRRVLLLEQYDVVGGNSHVFRRRRRYEFDVGVHYLGDCGLDGLLPAILSGLGAREGVAFRKLDSDCFDRIMVPSCSVDVPASWPKYRARLKLALPDDAEGLDRFVGIIESVANEQRALLLAPSGMSSTDVIAMTPNVQAWSRRTLAELFDHCALSPAARTVLAAQSPNYGMGPAQATVSMHAVVIDHYIRGAYFPSGGGQMLAATLTEVIEANGGELRTKSRVDRIQVAGRAVRGVVLSDGTELSAPIVISNADYRRTVLDLVGPEHFSKKLIMNTREAEMCLPYATTYVALDREITNQTETNIWWYDTDDIDAYYRQLTDGRHPDEIKFLFISFGSLKDPGSRHICPPGHSNFQLMTLCPPTYQPWGIENGPTDGTKYRRLAAYRAEKERFTEAMVVAAERVLGPFRDSIAHLELATPLTQERYTMSTGGTPFGLAKWGTAGTRPGTGTSVAGLYVVGQSTRYGSGITGVMVGGLACAGRILERPLLSEVHSGAVVGNPSLLPDRPDGWDPLVVSRGLQRRVTRGP